jgi:hypothetical protein
MMGSGENAVTLFPDGIVAIPTAKTAGLPEAVEAYAGEGPMTTQALERLGPF